jgi:chromate reductase
MAESDALTFLGLCGSLRAASYNRAALRAAQELAPPDVRLETFDLAEVPVYNDDVRLKGYPPAVQELRARIKAADALLFSSPEYNYSVSGVLKNAIDWASRPPDQPFDGKPCAMIGASGGMLGTARAQYHLRQIGVYLNMQFLNRPEVMIAQAASKFDAQGRLSDETARKLIAEQLVALAAWTRRLRG